MGTQQTSGVLASEIITQVRANINEATAEFWSDADLLQWVNDGIKDIAKKTSCYQTIESIDLVASQVEYTITTTNYIKVDAVHYVSPNKTSALQLSSPNLVGRVEDVEEPEYYYDWAGKIGAFPVLPTRTTETLNLYIVPMPATIISSAAIPTPEPYDLALVYYVTARAWWRDRQMAKWAQAMAAYDAELQRLKVSLVPMSERPER
jgi:hypothetical protein